jgi:hypothetical protein
MAARKIVEQVRPGALLMSWKDMLKIAAAGALTGVVTMLLYVAFDKYVFSPTLCSDLNVATGRCENKLLFASGVALILGSVPVLFFFVQQRVYRPLLVILLAVATLWGMPLLLGVLAMHLAGLLSIVLFALTYLTYAWLVQIRNFPIALGLSLFVVILIKILF